jgi:iron complex outermembrane receptor protein
MSKGTGVAFVLAAAIVASALPIAAQSSGSIEGRVTRGGGQALGGVAVVITELGEATLSNSNGVFSFSGVAPGSYTLSFALGDNSTTLEGVSVTAGASTNADLEVDWVVSLAESITVFSASRRMEKIVDAPSAVTVITATEIAREAPHGQIPKLLEFTPGVEVTQSGIYDFNLNTRGFNSSLNRRVATLIDGRDPSVPFLGAQEWASISYPVDDFSGMEMVRGPSAALYGANASSGVLNMVTKRPRDYQGGQLRLTAGELSTINADLRFAGSFGDDWYYKILGGLRDHDDWAQSRNMGVEYEGLPPEGVPLELDNNEISFYGLRLDKYINNESFFTVEAGNGSLSGPVFQTGIGRVQLVDVDRPWGRFNYFHPRWNLAANYSARDASEQLSLSSGFNLALDSTNLSLEAQANWEFGEGRSQLVVGASYQEDDLDTLDKKTGQQTLMFEPVEANYSAAYAQLDVNLSDSLRFVVAGRVDESDLHSTQFSPKGALVWAVNENHTLRLTYNEAFQVANYSEFYLQANVAAPADLSAVEAGVCTPFGVECGLGLTPILAVGNESLDLEEISTLEIGYNAVLGGKTLMTLDVYWSEATNFITDLIPQLGTSIGRTNPNFGPWVAPSDIPEPLKTGIETAVRSLVPPILTNNVDGSTIMTAVSYTNFGDVDTNGVDFGLTSQFAQNWSLNFTYSWFDFDVVEDLPGFETLLVPNTPEHRIASGVSFVTGDWNTNLSGRWVDDFDWAVGPFVGVVKSYVTFDLNADYRVSDAVTVGLTVTNLFDDEHYQAFGGDLIGRRALGTVAFSW